ncbi:MAG: MBL fold metallo-hydrolase [Thermacetogeniaceae bacterium]
MKLADGVEVLELPFKNPMGMQGVVNLTLIWDQDTVVLADTGFPGQLPQIREGMDRAGVPFDRLGKVIITHQDVDHVGGLPDILKESAHKVEVLAHAVEKPYIEGSKPLLKMNPERLAKAFASLPEEQRKKMEAVFANPPKAGVDVTVADGEVLPYCGGITVIFTPGHTLGHISLYLNQSKVLVTGDALVAADGELLGPNPQVTYDLDLALKSLKKLTQYDIETVVCYHGGVYQKNANQRLKELANG